jgi:hypothetical protein
VVTGPVVAGDVGVLVGTPDDDARGLVTVRVGDGCPDAAGSGVPQPTVAANATASAAAQIDRPPRRRIRSSSPTGAG